MPTLRKRSAENAIRNGLNELAEDYELSDAVVNEIVDAYFNADTYGIEANTHRAQLLRAEKELQTASDKLAAFEKAWQAALANNYLLNHLLNAYVAILPTDSRDDAVRKQIDGIGPMLSMSDLAPMKKALDTVAQRNDFRVPGLPSQTKGKKRDVRVQHLVAVLYRIAERLKKLRTSEARHSFVIDAMKTLGFDQTPKAIKHRRQRRGPQA